MTLNDALLKVGTYYIVRPLQPAPPHRWIIKIKICRVHWRYSIITEDNGKEFKCAHSGWGHWPAFTNYWLAYAESLKREAEHEVHT